MKRCFGRLRRDCKGGTAIEYGLILALVFLAMLSAVVGLAGKTIGMWQEIGDKVVNAA